MSILKINPIMATKRSGTLTGLLKFALYTMVMLYNRQHRYENNRIVIWTCIVLHPFDYNIQIPFILKTQSIRFIHETVLFETEQ